MDDKLFTIQEVCKYLKTSKSTIYKLSQKKELPSVKIGKQLRFKKSSIDSWLNKKEGRQSASTEAQLPIYEDRRPMAAEKNVLVIDDDPLVLKSLDKLFKARGCKIELAANGEEAIKKAKKEKFDLLIADVRMPGIDGIETIRQIRKINSSLRRQSVPEIIITGYIDPQVEREAEKLGIVEYLYKPFAVSDLISAINRKLSLYTA